MESPARRRLTAAEGRRFALTLAFGFAVLGAVVWWRDMRAARNVLFGLAGVAVLAGVLAPTHLGPVSRAWAAFGMALSRVTSPVFFTLIYIVVIAPIGLARRTFGKSPLARNRTAASFWIKRDAPDDAAGRAALERQF